MQPADILSFWFEEIPQKSWWQKDEAFDRTIRDRFLKVHAAAVAGELFSWRKDPSGRLAEVIVLDQFSRNIYRDRPEAFAYDGQALALAQEAVSLGVLDVLETVRQPFLILPYMHSESTLIHELAVELFSRPGLESNLDFEHKHKAIVDRFGRYPHRNDILGRKSTPEEQEFLEQPGSSF